MKYIKVYENFESSIVVYHGTDVEHMFTKTGNMVKGTFFSVSINEAKSYGKYVYKITLVDNLNIFNTCNLKDANKLFKNFDVLYDTYYNEGEDGYEITSPISLSESNDNWEPIENTPGVLNWIESEYDGCWIYEGGIKNLLLFIPVNNKIKHSERL